jgi:hypothetical protein
MLVGCEARLSALCRGLVVVISPEIQTAVRLVLPMELAKHAIVEGTKAFAKMSA